MLERDLGTGRGVGRTNQPKALLAGRRVDDSDERVSWANPSRNDDLRVACRVLCVCVLWRASEKEEDKKSGESETHTRERTSKGGRHGSEQRD